MRSDTGTLTPNKTPDRIYAILQANAPCTMTQDQIRYELEERFDVTPSKATVLTAMHRLVAKGYATSKVEVWLDYDTGGHGPEAGVLFGRTSWYVQKRRMLLGVA